MTGPDLEPAVPLEGDAPLRAEAVVVKSPVPDLPAAPGAGRVDRFVDGIVDRLNPILVREVRQAVNGRGFVITASLALLGTVLIGLFAASAGSSLGRGASVFVGAMEVLAPIVLFIVPLQAFLSTRQEVTRGSVEHLLLSRLTPGQIVRGKLLAATVQFVIYLGIFSPLLAMTFLLRGVDIPTIAYALLLAFLSGLAAASLGVACGALSRWPNMFRILPLFLMVFGLIALTWGAMVFIAFALFDVTRVVARGEFWMTTVSTLLPVVGATVLCGLVGSAALAHPYENKSTGFRVFALLLLLATLAWFAFLIAPTVSFSGLSATELWILSGVMAGVLALFAIFASTEAPKLTPRARAGVPRSDLLRFLSIPLLPGAGRGLLFTLLLAAISLFVPYAFQLWGNLGTPIDEVPGLAVLAWAYLILYAGIAAFVRSRLGQALKYNWIARAVPLGLLLLMLILPALAEVVLGARSVGDWAIYRVLEPFSTIAAHSGSPHDPEDILGVVLALVGIVLVLNLVLMFDGVTEVMGLRKTRKTRKTRRTRGS